MPVLDTPITTDDRNLKKVLGQKQPALLVLHDGRQTDKPLQNAMKKIARQNAGELLVVRVDAHENPDTYARYDEPDLPALVTLTKAFFGRKIKSSAEGVRPSDLRAHVDHLMNDKPLPEERAQSSNGHSSGKVKHAPQVNDRTFRKAVLKSNVPVLVDFWAVWCGPCQTIAPFIDQMADKYKGKIKVVKLNTDQNQATSGQYSIRSIPTFIMFDKGKPVARLSGANPRAIEQMIQETLNR